MQTENLSKQIIFKNILDHIEQRRLNLIKRDELENEYIDLENLKGIDFENLILFFQTYDVIVPKSSIDEKDDMLYRVKEILLGPFEPAKVIYEMYFAKSMSVYLNNVKDSLLDFMNLIFNTRKKVKIVKRME